MASLSERRYRPIWQGGILCLLTGWLYAPIAWPVLQQCWQDPNYT